MRINVAVGSEQWGLYQERRGKDVMSWVSRWVPGFREGRTHYAIAKRVGFHDAMDAVSKGGTVLEQGGTGHYIKIHESKMCISRYYETWEPCYFTDDCFDLEYLVLPEEPTDEQ